MSDKDPNNIPEILTPTPFLSGSSAELFSDLSDIQKPSSSLQNPSASLFGDLALISEVFQRIEQETAKIAEIIFDYLVSVDDASIMVGEIPEHENRKVNNYVKILNRLFKLSRGGAKTGLGIKIISRKTVKELDKKTYAICMCYDGGVSMDILCDIVNAENQARAPKSSLVKVTVKRFAADKNDDKTLH